MLRALRDPLRRIAILWRGELAAVASGPGRGRLALRVGAIWLVETIGLILLARLLPGLTVDSPVAALGLVVAVQVGYAVVRPIVVYVLLPLLILTLGLLGLVVNAAIVWLAAAIVPGVAVDGPLTAFLVAIGLGLVNLVVIAVADIGGEGGYYRAVTRRLARRGRAPVVRERPGLLVIQIDGLAHDVFADALRTGRMPTLASWVRGGSHRLVPWRCDLPSQTSASQAGLLHGRNDDIPAFRWYEKGTGRLLVSNRPADAAEIERRLSNGRGLLARNGSSVGNLFSGDATRNVLTMSRIVDLSPGIGRRSRDFLLFFVDPYAVTRVLAGMVAEVVRELYEGRRQRRRRVEPRIDRLGAFLMLRAVGCVLLRELNVTLLVEDMARGVAVTYCDFVGYDEMAHHAGPERPESLRSLEPLDRAIEELVAAAATAPRPYRVVVLSDHGQSQGATFRQRTGATLEATIAASMRGEPVVRAATTPVEGWGHLSAFLSEALAGRGPILRTVRRAIGRRDAPAGWVEVGPTGTGAVTGSGGAVGAGSGAVAAPAELVVCASGNLALVYFPALEGRASAAAIEAVYPGLIERLRVCPWVGAILVRDASGGSVVGPAGSVRLVDGAVEGSDPLAPYGDGALASLRRLDGMATVGDLAIMSAVDPLTGEVAAFEELVGSHGGLGGAQTRPFILAPSDLPLPDGPIVGAPAVGAILAGWVAAELPLDRTVPQPVGAGAAAVEAPAG
jgi:uncharacterized membrane protein YvlD (DUF360 family)